MSTKNQNIAKNLTEEEKDDLAKTIGGLEELEALNRGSVIKWENLEREITYRRFYFPGSVVKLQVEGSGIDTDEINYREDSGNTIFDPRYIKSYITQANQYGFYKHIIAWDVNTKKHKSFSFDDVSKVIKQYVDMYNTSEMSYKYLKISPSYTSDEKEKVKNNVLHIISAMNYFDKWKSFFKQYTEIFLSNIEKIQNYYKSTIQTLTRELENFIGQSQEEFIENDYGYFAPINLAFDCEKFIKEFNKYQEEYELYRDRLWEILANTPSLNIVGNRISGTFVATGNSEISLTQMNEIVQDMKEINKYRTDLDVENNENSLHIPQGEAETDQTNSTIHYDSIIDERLRKIENRAKKVVNIFIIIFSIFIIFISVYFCIYKPIHSTKQIHKSSENIDL